MRIHILVPLSVVVVVGFLVYLQYDLRLQLKETSLKNESMMRRHSMTAPSAKSGGRPAVDPFLQNQVKNTIVKNSRSLQVCYNEFLEKADGLNFDGKIRVEWRIDGDGTPRGVDKISSNIPRSEDFSNCLKTAISTWSFPMPPYKDYYVSHDFRFSKVEEKGGD